MRITSVRVVSAKNRPLTQFAAGFIVGAHELPNGGRLVQATVLSTAEGDSAGDERFSGGEFVPNNRRKDSDIAVVPTVGVAAAERLVGSPWRRVF